MTIAENVAAIRERMTQAALRAGRDPKDVLLCAATKMNGTPAIRKAVAAGVDCCGENRVQELLEKQPQGAYEGVPLHFIGRLQTNKVNKLVGRVALIQSVDRIELLEAIDRAALRLGCVQDILLEIHLGGEESKTGFTCAEARELAAHMRAYPGVRLQGLMTIPPVSLEKGGNCKYFAEMRNLFVDIGRKTYDNVSMVYLSMGMTDDFEDAISEGATMIRIGTAIFGARSVKK